MPTLFRFGPFALSPAERSLRRNGEPLALTPKAFDLLVALVEARGRLVEKDALIARVWAGTFVDEAVLTQNIFTLRKALGDGGSYIETVPKFGYRFSAPIVEVAPPVEAATRFRRRALVIAPLLIALTAAAFLVATPRETQPPREKRTTRSIAVLPFKSLSNDPHDNYLGLAMADALITRLGNMRRVVVRPTSSIRSYANSGAPATEAARKLGVDAIVEGNIQRDGDRIRVSVQLIGDGGTSLWGNTFDVAYTDMFTVEDRVAEHVARALIAGLGVPARIERRTNDPVAQEAYLKGRYFWNKRTEDGFRRAIAEFRKAVERDPEYAAAYSGLADAYALLGSMPNRDMPRGVALPLAKEYAKKAIALDDTLAEGHASLAFVLMHYEYDWPSAERQFRRALDLDPGYATAHHWYAFYLAAMNRMDEALASVRRAQALDPLSAIISTDVAEILFFARRYDEALAQLEHTLALDPQYPLALRTRALNLAAKGDRSAALALLRRAVDAGRPDTMLHIATTYAFIGERDKARDLLSRYQQQRNENVNLELAGLYFNLGEKDRGFAELEAAYRERNGGLIIMNHLGFDSVFHDPRYRDLVRRLRLPMPG